MNRRLLICAFGALFLFSACGEKEPEVIIPAVYPDNGGDDGDQHKVLPPYDVECKKTVTTANWTTYQAYTVDCLDGFKPEADPETDQYGGWTIMNLGNPDGFFRVQKAVGRWWLVDPLGNIYLSKGVAVFSPGSSARQRENIQQKFGPDNANTNWAKAETQFLREAGFNSLGAWSSVDVVRTIPEPMPYTVILSPMSTYIGELKRSSDPVLKAAFSAAGWEGYPYDFAMVFDARFDQIVESTISRASTYKNDKYLIGYFIDNEIPWKSYALEYCLTKWPESHINHQKAQEWLDQRKGKTGALLSEATTEDRNAFIAYCHEVYLQKVSAALKKYDPNHLFLGSRFNQWSHELVNPEMFKVAGKYVDAVSLNHYQKWEPDADAMHNWEHWAGKPFMVTEFYTKGVEDTDLPNSSGAGWCVPTQKERAYAYQHFTLGLLEAKNCVGWTWFKSQDDDFPDNSNCPANKGLYDYNYQMYPILGKFMREVNFNVYDLINYFDGKL